MQTFFVFLTVLVFESTRALDNMGPCDKDLVSDASMHFPLFGSENGGSWSVVRAVNTTFIAGLRSLSYNIQPATNTDQYNLSMFYVKKSGENGTFTQEVMTDVGNGVAVSRGSDFTLNISFLKYVPGRYAYYYICSTEGADNTLDYRYVLAHKELTENEETDIKRIDRSYSFKGKLTVLSWY